MNGYRTDIPNQPGIYLIRCILNAKVYVGSSVSLRQRRRDHKKLLVGQRHFSKHLQSAWNLYGPDSFEFVIIEQCSAGELLVREQYWIDLHRSADPEFGFNSARMAGKTPRQTWWLGRKKSQVSKDKMAAASTLMWAKPEFREYVCARMKGKTHRMTDTQKQAVAQLREAKRKPEWAEHSRDGQLGHKRNTPDVCAKISQAKGGPNTDAIRLVRKLLREGKMTNIEISTQTRISLRTISRIKSGQRFSWVPDEP